MPGAEGRSKKGLVGRLADSSGALEAEKGRQGSTTAWVNPDQLRETYSAVRATSESCGTHTTGRGISKDVLASGYSVQG